MSKTIPFALAALFLVLVALVVTAVPAASGALLRSTDPSAQLQGVCPDQYEPDNSFSQAKPILPNGAAQRHTFDPVGDQDWKRFQATAGRTYTATTFNLLLDTDTTLRLYEPDGVTVVVSNDDYQGSPEPLASQIVWTAPADGQYYLRIRDFYGRGDCLGYDINLIDDMTPVAGFGPWVPMLLKRYSPPPTPTASATSTATATATPTATDTPTATPSPTVTDTPTATPSATVTDTPTATPSPTVTNTATAPAPTATSIAVPGLDAPNGLAVNPDLARVYVASRNSDSLFVLDGEDQSVLAELPVGNLPFGVAANPLTGRVYVVNFGDTTLSVIDGLTNQLVTNVSLAPELTFVAVNAQTNRIYAVSHAANMLYVLDGATNTLLNSASTGINAGAFGLTVSESLNRVYVSNRDSQKIVTFDGDGNVLASQGITPQPPGAVPYALGFNDHNNKLYVTLASGATDVNTLQVYQAGSNGLTLLTTASLPSGGMAGGGGVAVNRATNRVFVTNSAANNVSIVDGDSNALVGLQAVGQFPYGIAVNPNDGAVYVGNGLSDNLSLFYDLGERSFTRGRVQR